MGGRLFIAGLVALGSLPALAVDTTLTQAGYTGLGITPNAHLLGWGRVEAAYDNQLPGVRDTSGHNYVLGFGLLPNIEIVGRLAANSIHNNCFTQGCGARDLSASGKLGIGLDAAGRWRAAGGVTDIGGSVTYFRTWYGVVTYNEGPFELNAGLAKRTRNGVNGSRSPLDGPFAGAAWQPLPWVRAHVEYTDSNAWAGAHLFAPKEWLPEGWTAHVGVNQRLNNNRLTERNWVSAGVSIPLYKVPALRGSGPKAAPVELSGTQLPAPVYEARTVPPTLSPAPAPAAPSSGASTPAAGAPATPARPAPNPATITPALAQTVAEALRAKGLEDISVGRMPDGSLAVRANNAAYNWNSADALGAALGALARTLGDTATGYRLVLTQRQTPLVAVTGQANCLREWIANESPTCTAGQLSTPGTGALEPLHAGAEWLVDKLQPSWSTLRVSASPVLRTSVGTEFGVYDYAVGANIGLQMPLWAGASFEVTHDFSLRNSEDYEPARAFGDRRIRDRFDRIAFVQTVRLPVERWIAPGDDVAARRWGLGAVTGQATVGRIGGQFDGALGELRWEPGEGRHRVALQAGLFDNHDFGKSEALGPRTAKPLLANYRYNVAPTRTYLEATGGNFFFNDVGVQLGLRQWFGDVALHVYYRRSKFENSAARQFGGIEISLPIGPRRDMDPRWHLQFTGTPRFTHGVETTLREGAGNPLRQGYGELPPVRTLDAVFNSDRAGLLYFEDNIPRIRDAAR